MGINLEYVEILDRLDHAGLLAGRRSVIEFGAQQLSVKRDVLHRFLRKLGRAQGLQPDELDTRRLYREFGFAEYDAIDTNGESGALVFDLNRDLAADFAFERRYDLVTNLGTAEHCFNQEQVFRNVHALCAEGGLMIHALPSQGWVNHGFFAYTPRFFYELAAANGYAIEMMAFTSNLLPRLIPYSLAAMRRHDRRDVLLYTVLRKTGDAAFRRPFDSVFSDDNLLADEYARGPQAGARSTGALARREFASYEKGRYYYIRYGRRSIVRDLVFTVREALRARRRRALPD